MNDKNLSLELANPNKTDQPDDPVECLGRSFVNDTERRDYYLAILADKLKDPEFRKIEGFPIGADEDILNLSDPPYYTACPNPFIGDFISYYGRPYDSSEKYKREPYAADVSEGRNHPIYNAHSYHTKVPHRAIMRYILNFTKPGDVVLDSFGGSGMLGVAAQLCGSKDEVLSLGYLVDDNGGIKTHKDERTTAQVGGRYAVVNDLSPIATFIAKNFNNCFNNAKLQHSINGLIQEVEEKLGWLYSTVHNTHDIPQACDLLSKGDYAAAADVAKGRLNYVLWSDLFICTECAYENIFWEAGVDLINSKINDQFNCTKCSSLIKKSKAERVENTLFDQALNKAIKQSKTVPVAIGY
ncbi:MAG: DNA methyltransferase, partial [Mariprofundaceae bacterium]|nr:DNA methyltransferase [Mariprofundaceae bacterium]